MRLKRSGRQQGFGEVSASFKVEIKVVEAADLDKREYADYYDHHPQNRPERFRYWNDSQDFIDAPQEHPDDN